jgi:hypothetical protein
MGILLHTPFVPSPMRGIFPLHPLHTRTYVLNLCLYTTRSSSFHASYPTARYHSASVSISASPVHN